MTTTNSNEAKSFTDRMREQLTNVRASVDGTLANIETTGSQASEDLRAKRAALDLRRMLELIRGSSPRARSR